MGDPIPFDGRERSFGLEPAHHHRRATVTIDDVASGGTATGEEGAQMTLPENALIDANGSVVQGSVDVEITAVDVSSSEINAFPGGFDGVSMDGNVELIESYGTVNFELSQEMSERERLSKVIHKSAKENSAIINSVSDIIFELSDEGKILFLNNAWDIVTGFEKERSIGRNR